MMRLWTLDGLHQLAWGYRIQAATGHPLAYEARDQLGKAVAPIAVELFDLVRAARVLRDSTAADFDEALDGVFHALHLLESKLVERA
jgi:hypothetical protein